MTPQAIQPVHSLQALLQGFDLFCEDEKNRIDGLALDSRKVKKGDLFFALCGGDKHGVDYIEEAVQKGAVAVISDHSVAQHQVPSFVIPELNKYVSKIAGRFYGEPSKSLWLIGVTGTNGKTSCSQFIAQALNETGVCGVMGTLGYGLPDLMHEATHTTPDPIRVQEVLAEMLANDATQAVMEVSSHGLEQYRVAGVQFDVAVFTNLSRDHLDYHSTMESYAAAKQKLFEMPSLQHGVINVGDAFGRELKEHIPDSLKTLCFSLQEELPTGYSEVDLLGSNLRFDHQGMHFDVTSPWGKATINTTLMGGFNASNLLAVLGVLLVSGIPFQEAVASVAKLKTVAGRMQSFNKKGSPAVVVDYAHTPDALQHALQALRPHCDGDLWCVFGCGGDRDKGKRPLMGQVAEQLADQVVVTDDNPRYESAKGIVEQIVAGMERGKQRVIHDRAEAINYAITSAQAGDVILIAGKGHESYQQVNDKKIPFSDSDVVQKMLKQVHAEGVQNG